MVLKPKQECKTTPNTESVEGRVFCGEGIDGWLGVMKFGDSFFGLGWAVAAVLLCYQLAQLPLILFGWMVRGLGFIGLKGLTPWLEAESLLLDTFAN